MRIHRMITRYLVVSSLPLIISRFTKVSAENMNGKPGQYQIANGLSGVKFSTDYDSEYFEVYSPLIRSRYSEVVWKMSDAIPLPEDIRERFFGKVMSVVGYEADQVRLTPDGEDVPVPITWAYNHHYGAWISNGRKVRMTKARAGEDSARGGASHGYRAHWKPQLLDKSDQEEGVSSEIYPLTTFFSEGNGGEYRMSYHGYPRGYAQLIDSPDTFHVSPMQIDTWNRDMVDAGFMAGPLPKSSRIPSRAGYSGLIECPCSDRLEKEWAMTYGIRSSGRPCNDAAAVRNVLECFEGGIAVVAGTNFTENTISDPSKTVGCTVEQHSDGSINVVWNSASAGDIDQRMELSGEGLEEGVVAFTSAQVNVTVSLMNNNGSNAATITIVGPADRWFGVGFGSVSMCQHMAADECSDGGPYAIIVGSDGVTERKLDYHGPGKVLPSSVIVKSSSVTGGNRIVVLARSLEGASDKYFTFDLATASVPIITAKGCSLSFDQHCGHGTAQLNFFPLDSPTSVCRAGIEGTIGGNKFPTERCLGFPKSDLKYQHNPTCSIQTYRGGLSCCRDGVALLDKGQDIPWPDQYLEYRLKFRFYFEEYQPLKPGIAGSSHQNLIRLYWQVNRYYVVCSTHIKCFLCVMPFLALVNEVLFAKPTQGLSLPDDVNSNSFFIFDPSFFDSCCSLLNR